MIHEPLNPWPDQEDFCEDANTLYETFDAFGYQRELCKCAMQRLRVAVKALQEMDVAKSDLGGMDMNHRQCVEYAREALALIGELPEGC